MRKMMRETLNKIFFENPIEFCATRLEEMIQLTNIVFVHVESPHELDNDQSLSCESKEKSPLDKRPWTASEKTEDCGDLDHSLRKFIFFAAIESLDMRKSWLFRTCSYLGMTCLEARCQDVLSFLQQCHAVQGSFASEIHWSCFVAEETTKLWRYGTACACCAAPTLQQTGQRQLWMCT